MEATKRIFISDIHLGTGKKYDWFKDKEHTQPLLKFFEYILENKKEIKEVVLTGDTFDTWVCPIDQKPPTFKEIIDHNKVIIDELKKCIDAIENVFFLNGNHDMNVTNTDIDIIKKNGKKIKYINNFIDGRLYAEHGSRFAMFNAPDKLHDPKDGLPIGYYISRLLAGRDDYIGPSAVLGYIDDLLEAAFTTQTIAESVIEALVEHTQKKMSDIVIMAEPRQSITIKEISKKYSGLFDRWVEKFGYRYAIHAIMGEMDSLDWFADRLCKTKDFKVVILGHTHSAMLDEDKLFVKGNRIYANSGYWCTDEPSFVEVDKPKDKKMTVRLMKYKNNKFSCSDEAKIL